MLQYWHILGREAVHYRSMIAGIKDSYLDSYCFQCKSDEDLSVNEF